MLHIDLNHNDKQIKVLAIAGSEGGSNERREFLNKLRGNDFSATVGSDFVTRDVDDTTYQVWDMAGQERFSATTTSYKKNANAVIWFNVSEEDRQRHRVNLPSNCVEITFDSKTMTHESCLRLTQPEKINMNLVNQVNAQSISFFAAAKKYSLFANINIPVEVTSKIVKTMAEVAFKDKPLSCQFYFSKENPVLKALEKAREEKRVRKPSFCSQQ